MKYNKIDIAAVILILFVVLSVVFIKSMIIYSLITPAHEPETDITVVERLLDEEREKCQNYEFILTQRYGWVKMDNLIINTEESVKIKSR